MKRIVALALVCLALLGLCARAESNAGIVYLSDLELGALEAGRVRSVRFDGATLRVALGESKGGSTVQVTFDNGEGQVVDGVAQLAGQQILLSMGGLSGTYIVDLETFATEGNPAGNIAKGLNGALSLAGSHLDVLLYAITSEQPDGMRAVEVALPMPQLIGMAQGLLSVTEGMEATQNVDMAGLRERVDEMSDAAMLAFRYDPDTGCFQLSALHDGQGMQLAGVMRMAFEPTTFIDITADEEKYDLLNLSPEALDQMKSELNMILIKFVHFADGTGLDNIMP